MNAPVFSTALLLLSSLSASGHADVIGTASSTPTATTKVKILSDWPGTEVIRNLGTSYGYGSIGGRGVSITVLHFERLCRAPCTGALQTEGRYFVEAPGMQARAFRLPPGSHPLDINVRGGNGVALGALTLSGTVSALVGITGGVLWGVFGSKRDSQGAPYDTTNYQAMTFIGGGVLVASIVGLVLLKRTHVETADGVRLDASASRSKVRITASGLTF